MATFSNSNQTNSLNGDTYSIHNAFQAFLAFQEKEDNTFLKQIREELINQQDFIQQILQEKWPKFYKNSQKEQKRNGLTLRTLLGYAFRAKYAQQNPNMDEDTVDKKIFELPSNARLNLAKNPESIAKLLAIAGIGYKDNFSEPYDSLKAINMVYQKSDIKDMDDTNNYPHVREVKDLLVWVCSYFGFFNDEYKILWNKYIKIDNVVKTFITLNDTDFWQDDELSHNDFANDEGNGKNNIESKNRDVIRRSLLNAFKQLDNVSKDCILAGIKGPSFDNACWRLWVASDINKNYTEEESNLILGTLMDYFTFDLDAFYTSNTIMEMSKLLKKIKESNKEEVLQSISQFIMEHYYEFSDVRNSLNYYVNCPIVKDAHGEIQLVNIIDIRKQYYKKHCSEPSQDVMIRLIDRNNHNEIARDDERRKVIKFSWFTIEYDHWYDSLKERIVKNINSINNSIVTNDTVTKFLESNIFKGSQDNKPSRNAVMAFIMDYSYNYYIQLKPNEPGPAYAKYLKLMQMESGTPLYYLNNKNVFDSIILKTCFLNSNANMKPIDVLVEMVAKSLQEELQKAYDYEK